VGRSEHAASRRVREKCGFGLEGLLRRYLAFPNQGSALQDTCWYVLLPRRFDGPLDPRTPDAPSAS
jgi:RimJ/RimL family protein N-acetyltransferase